MVTLFHYLPISCLYMCIIYKHDNLVRMHIIIYKEIKLFLFSSIFYLYTLLIVQNVIFCTYKSKFVPLNDISQIEERLISQILFWTQDV